VLTSRKKDLKEVIQEREEQLQSAKKELRWNYFLLFFPVIFRLFVA